MLFLPSKREKSQFRWFKMISAARKFYEWNEANQVKSSLKCLCRINYLNVYFLLSNYFQMMIWQCSQRLFLGRRPDWITSPSIPIIRSSLLGTAGTIMTLFYPNGGLCVTENGFRVSTDISNPGPQSEITVYWVRGRATLTSLMPMSSKKLYACSIKPTLRLGRLSLALNNKL